MSPVPDPSTAPPRTDLPFLTHRSARRAPAPPAPAPASGPAARGSADASPVAAFIRGEVGHGPHPPAAPAAQAPAASSLDLSTPVAPTASGPPPGPTPSASSSLDLSAPVASPGSAPSSSLDLSGPATPPAGPAPSAPIGPPAPATPPARRRSRVGAGEQRILDSRTPSVWLTRVQSGVGQLRIEAVCSPSVGDLRLGAAYQFASGATSVMQFAGGNRFAPSSRRPVLIGGHDEYENLRVDLRQIQEIERVTVYAFSESRTPLTWGGTVVVETFADSRLELPLEPLPAGRVAVLLSLYNVGGELVVRTELETVDGDIREAARAYGYDRITWRDERTPVD